MHLTNFAALEQGRHVIYSSLLSARYGQSLYQTITPIPNEYHRFNDKRPSKWSHLNHNWSLKKSDPRSTTWNTDVSGHLRSWNMNWTSQLQIHLKHARRIGHCPWCKNKKRHRAYTRWPKTIHRVRYLRTVVLICWVHATPIFGICWTENIQAIRGGEGVAMYDIPLRIVYFGAQINSIAEVLEAEFRTEE